MAQYVAPSCPECRNWFPDGTVISRCVCMDVSSVSYLPLRSAIDSVNLAVGQNLKVKEPEFFGQRIYSSMF